MRSLFSSLCAFPFAVVFWAALSANAANDSSRLFDIAAIRDPSTLETTVVHDWKPYAKDPSIRQKLIEITICEWWPGQKVRLPVTLSAPANGGPCRNVLLVNQTLPLKTARLRAEELTLLKEHGVGVVMVGMGTIEAMKPVGRLHDGMREQLLKTKDVRFSPAWIWGMSQMRGLTAAAAEPEAFQPEKVLATGGSKRGVGAAVAGIHDDRITAIQPVVAPPMGNPGGVVVLGTESKSILNANKEFFADLGAGKLGLPATTKEALEGRNGRRVNVRITLEQARAAGWSDAEIDALTDRYWDAGRIVDFLMRLRAREFEYFYTVGANDSVSPALLQLGKLFPDFPIHITPGGQHGGPVGAGFDRRTPVLPEVKNDFMTFALHHFFDARAMLAPPNLSHSWNAAKRTLLVEAKFTDGSEPQGNALWWAIDKSEPFTLPFEYDKWAQVKMKRIGKGKYAGRIRLDREPQRLDVLTVHTHEENDLSLTISSPYLRVAF